MTANLIVPELARAWQNYFREKGGMSPNIPQEIVPVVIMDDNSKGPYPPCRHWHFGTNLGPIVSNYSYIEIFNADDLKSQRSICVVDQVWVRSGTVLTPTAADFLIGVTPFNNAFSEDQTRDVIIEKEQAVNDPLFNNVRGGTTALASALVASIFPAGVAGVVSNIPGPFVLGPQQALLLTTSLLNNAISAYFRGRYYASL